MAQTTTLTAPAQVPSAITDRLVGVKPYIVIGQLFLVAAMLVEFGAVQGQIHFSDRYYLPIGLIGFIVPLVAPRDAVRRVFVSIPLLLLFTYLVCSIAWGPSIMAFRSAFEKTVPVVIGVTFVASILPFERIVQALKVGFLIGIAFSFYAVITDPMARIHTLDAGAATFPGWRGSFEHKNGLVPFLVFACITFVIFERRRWLRWTVIASALVLTIGSQSATGMSCFVVVLCAAWWLNAYLKQDLRMSGSYIALSLFGAIAVAVVITVLLPWLVNLYGKDLTFTNRTDIWSATVDAINDRPIAGYGWNGAWVDVMTEPTITLNREIGFEAGHAHNAVLEMLLEGGVIGLALYLTFFGSVGAAAWRALRTHPDIARWVILFIVAQVVVGLSEVTLFQGWILTLVLMRGILAQKQSIPRAYA
jgi:O-antigen ligase